MVEKEINTMEVKITYRVWEELAHRYGATHYSDACIRFIDKACDTNPTRRTPATIQVTQEEIDAVCNEVLNSIVNLQFGEKAADRAERAQRDRHGNAMQIFINTNKGDK